MGSLPMVLWQYGLIDLQQLDEVLDWIDKRDINDVELSY
ncbi:hypothetical protein CWATWH0402_183 [Crocosphaera watsonii WH 0402]|nr:hypothetical protein CWATWH0402_183 [Crocosphaera watsonii WH 0402]